jgi:hypothetical protein
MATQIDVSRHCRNRIPWKMKETRKFTCNDGSQLLSRSLYGSSERDDMGMTRCDRRVTKIRLYSPLGEDFRERSSHHLPKVSGTVREERTVHWFLSGY